MGYAKMIKKWLAIAGIVFLAAVGLAQADGLSGMKTPAPAATDDGRTIRLTPDKTKILHLDQDAASVVVANPAHASVLMDSPRLLVIMPREPGTTSFTVLDAAGAAIMERSVIVTATEPKYVRVRRMCDGQQGCEASSYFYCPDGCYEVTPVPGDTAQTDVPAIAATAPPAPASSSEEEQPQDGGQ